MATITKNCSPKLAVIDYGMGNLRSVLRAWQHVGAEAELVVTPEAVGDADALIFPGQGAMVDAMRLLRGTGFDAAIKDWIAADKPFFGICLGLQALFEHSEEGDCEGLGIFEGSVEHFQLDPKYKIPHMGWNAVKFDADAPLVQGFESGVDQFYFVHSYYVRPKDLSKVWFESDYGGSFVSGVRSGRCVATQFHPEKSQSKGLQLYSNFMITL